MQNPNIWLFEYLNLASAPEPKTQIISLMTAMTHLGDGEILMGAAGLGAVFLAVNKTPKKALIWAVWVAAIFALSAGLKQLFDLPRPDAAYHLIEASSPSFPSGHALRSAFIYPVLAGLFFQMYDGPKRLMLTASILLTAVIGLSRILLGVHWPLDVLAGWIIGGGAALLFARQKLFAHEPAKDTAN